MGNDGYVHISQLNKPYSSKLIGNSGYVDNTGKMHIYKNENETDYTIKVSTDLTYESYQDFTIDTNKLISINASNDTSAMTECNKDESCIGIFNDGTNNYYKLTKDSIKDLYYSKNNGSSVLIKKYSVGEENIDKSCPSMSEHVNMIDLHQWKSHTNDSSVLNKDNVKCHIINYLGEEKNTRDLAYDEMMHDYNEFMKVYNNLNEQDMKYINDTKINMKKMKDDMIKYNEIMKVAEKNMLIEDTVSAQYKETSQMHTKSEFYFAVGGLLTIGALIAMMKTMKK